MLDLTSRITNKIYYQDYVSHQIRSETLDIFFNIRPSARLLLRYGKQAKKYASFLINIGLNVSISKGYVLHKKSSTNTYQDWFCNDFDKIESNDQTEKMVAFYISKNLKNCEYSRKMDETSNDRLFGNALGYPSCCVKFVVKNKRPPTIVESFKLYSYNSSYNPYIWPCSLIVDANLISHFPCNKKCKLSFNLAKKRWYYINKFANKKIHNHYIHFLSKYYNLKKNNVYISNKKEKGSLVPQFLL